MDYLNDLEFLQQICSQEHQVIYTKINLLDLEETPLQSLEGIVTGGNVSLDGTSALARSFSCTLTVPFGSEFTGFQWTLESKIQVFIGVKNTINNSNYNDFDIIYFPMGIFYLNSFNLTENNSGYSISVQGKDKMAKLTGDLGGLFGATTDLGAIDIIDLKKQLTTKELIPIKQIITELIHFYGHEPYEKIFIQDIDDYGLNLVTYRGDEDLYYFIQFKECENEIIPYITNCRFAGSNIKRKINKNTVINDLEDEENSFSSNNPEDDTVKNTDIISFNALKNLLAKENIGIKKIQLYTYDYSDNTIKSTKLEGISNETTFYQYLNKLVAATDKFMIGKYKYGDTIGYELTQLVYSGDLIANPGESVTSILDKIKKMLGDFIYFYDLNGNFIFKKRNEYLNEDKPLSVSFSQKSPNYILTDKIIQSFQHTYNVSNIKNDFTVWGQQKLATGTTIDLHARYVIDEKPQQYVSLNITEERAEMLVNKYPKRYYFDTTISRADVISNLVQEPICYYMTDYSVNGIKTKQVDWREIIYQMAVDYNRFNQIDEYQEWLGENNYNYQNGETGYERYYTDLLGFWRDIYQPDKTTIVPQLQDLKTDDNIEYSIKLVNSEEDSPNESFMCTSKGIEWRGGFKYNKYDYIEVPSSATLKEDEKYYKKYLSFSYDIALEQYWPANPTNDSVNKKPLKERTNKIMKDSEDVFMHPSKTYYTEFPIKYNIIKTFNDAQAAINSVILKLFEKDIDSVKQYYIIIKSSQAKLVLMSPSSYKLYRISKGNNNDIIIEKCLTEKEINESNKYVYCLSVPVVYIRQESPSSTNNLYKKELNQERMNRQNQLKKEVGLLNSPTLLELQMGDQNGRVFYFTQPSRYKNIKWDISSKTLPSNLQLYKRIYNQNTGADEYLALGTTDNIIETNYKILGYMYYMLSPWVYWQNNSKQNLTNIYLIREDLETHKRTKWAGNNLYNILKNNAKKYDKRFNFYTNAAWTFVKNGEATFIGNYYDLTTLYYKSSDLITILSQTTDLKVLDEDQVIIDPSSGVITFISDENEENENEDENSVNKVVYYSIDKYPRNKNGDSLTNIQNMDTDKMALLLWARENGILQETNNNFQDDGFHKNVFEQPDKLKFWFDFLSADKFNQIYSVKNIGPREVVKKDTSINCITTQAIPDMIFINPNTTIADTAEQQLKIQQSYFKQCRPNSSFLHLDLESGKKLTRAYTTKSAMDVIINLLYNHAIAPNALTVSCIPQYYLKPDSLAWILKKDNNIAKQYVINKISMALGHSGMMTINLQEFVDNILDEQIQREIIVETK